MLKIHLLVGAALLLSTGPAAAQIPIPTPQNGAAAIATTAPAIPLGVGSTSPVNDFQSPWGGGDTALSADSSGSNVSVVVSAGVVRMPVVKPGVQVLGSDRADLGQIVQVKASGAESRVTLRRAGRSVVIDGRALVATDGATLLYDQSSDQVWGPGV